MRFFFLALFTWSSAALAIPTQIGHQGRVLDADGLPAEGLHTLEFRLYDAEEEGALMWVEAHEVDLINGYYSMVLGTDEVENPLEDELFQDNDLFLELVVDDGTPLSPRQGLNAVPYARLAARASSVSGGVVDATEIRVDGEVVIDSGGSWVSSTPDVDWSDITGIPTEIADATYAIASDLSDVATSGSYDDLSDLPAEPVATGASAVHYAESGSFTVPDGVTTLSVYVTGGGGGGSNGGSTELDLGTHNHNVTEHSHDGGSHTHAIGDHTHEGGGAHTHVIRERYCVHESCCGCLGWAGPDYSGEATGGGGAGSGSTGAVDDGATGAIGLTTDDSDPSSGTVSHNGGDGGSGGGMNVLFTVSPGAECDISIGTGGDLAEAGTSTRVSCGDQSVECGGGSAGSPGGLSGDDGVCTAASGTPLSEYKASRFAPGGGGSGGNGSGAAAGQAGTVAIRY